MLQVQYNINYPKFTGRNVPIAEIAKAMGISRSYVSRIEKKALKKLKKELYPK